jgi:hypothetical protein
LHARLPAVDNIERKSEEIPAKIKKAKAETVMKNV